ncbi:MAG: acetyltransferase [Gammaproteobacteria bacterium]
MPKNNEYTIEALQKQHHREHFDCGTTALNQFIQTYARQNQKSNISKTYVASPIKPPKNIMGFYTLASGQIAHNELPTTLKHPRYPVSIARLVRLAVDKEYQGNGLGGHLLYDALTKIKNVADVIGIFAVVVDAKDKAAQKFYQHYEFLPLQNSELTLFLPMSTINNLFK